MNGEALHRGLLLLFGVVVLSVWAWALWRAFRPAPGIENLPTVPLAEVVAAVKKELRAAESQSGEGSLPLTAVTLELQVATKKTAEQGLDAVLVVGGPSSAASNLEESAQIQKIYVKLKPPRPDLTRAAIDLQDLHLATAIESLRKDLQRGMDDPPRLEPIQAAIELSFSLKRGTTSGAGVELEVFSLDSKLAEESVLTHKIRLDFGSTEEGGDGTELTWDSK